MFATKEKSYIAPRDVKQIVMAKENVGDFRALEAIGIGFDEKAIQSFGFDATEPLVTTANMGTPVQFLQNWLPGFVNTITGARKIDEITGIMTAGAWSDEEVVQGVMSYTGRAQAYGDYTNVPLASWNVNFERRSVVNFEQGMTVGIREEDRASRMKVDSASSKRGAAALQLEIQRNNVGFYGYNSGANRTYGFLNDPNFPAYVANPGPTWSTATFLNITGDIRYALAALRSQSQDNIDPSSTKITLAIATNVVDFLTVTSDFGISVRDWLAKTYPNVRVVSAPELNLANGGENVLYAYAEEVNDGSTDDGRVFVQVVPAKFQLLGVSKGAKSYSEDYTNATAGIMCKRPWAVVRLTGL